MRCCVSGHVALAVVWVAMARWFRVVFAGRKDNAPIV
jgi:hypothetical protein